MASISVTESDFSVLAFAAQAAHEAGYEADAKRLDTLARKVNAALTGDNMTVIRRALEHPAEAAAVEEGKRLGLRSLKLELRHDAGWPDRLFILDRGRTFWMELKAPGGHPDELQLRRIDFLRSRGHDVDYYDDADCAVAALRARV